MKKSWCLVCTNQTKKCHSYTSFRNTLLDHHVSQRCVTSAPIFPFFHSIFLNRHQSKKTILEIEPILEPSDVWVHSGPAIMTYWHIQWKTQFCKNQFCWPFRGLQVGVQFVVLTPHKSLWRLRNVLTLIYHTLPVQCKSSKFMKIAMFSECLN